MPRPVRILVIGDSTANALGTGIVNWAAANPDRAQAEVVAAPGCGFLQGGERLVGERMEATSDCDGWVADLVIPEITALQPDVVVAMVTSWDLIDRRWDDGPLLTPFDPAYAEHLRADYSAVVDGALAAGAGSVALIRHPVPDVWWLHDRTGQSDPVRHDAIFGLYDELSSGRPTVRVVDLAGWLGAQGLDTDQATRPDGIHLDPASATALTEAFLGEELLRVVLGMPGAWSDAP